MDFQRNLYTYTATVYTYISRVCSLYEIAELSACLYLRIHGVERTRVSCEIRRLVYTTKIRERIGEGKWRKRIHWRVLHDFITRVSSARIETTGEIFRRRSMKNSRNSDDNDKIVSIFSPSIVLETIVIPCVSFFDFIISICYESVWIRSFI